MQLFCMHGKTLPVARRAPVTWGGGGGGRGGGLGRRRARRKTLFLHLYLAYMTRRRAQRAARSCALTLRTTGASCLYRGALPAYHLTYHHPSLPAMPLPAEEEEGGQAGSMCVSTDSCNAC